MKPWDRERIAARVRSALLGGATLVLIGLIFYLGTRTERSGFMREVIDPGFRRLSTPVLKAFRGKPPPVTRLELEMDPASWDSLEAWCDRAFTQQRLGAVPAPAPIPGLARIGDRSQQVRVGTHPDLLPAERPRFWPFEVNIDPPDTLLAMQRFEVRPFTDDGLLWAILFQTVMVDQGLVAPPVAVMEITVNDRDLGLVGSFGTVDATVKARLPGSTGHVLRFDDALLLNTRRAMGERTLASRPPPQGDWLASPLLIQGGTDRHLSTARKAVHRLEAFRAGTLPASTLFEPDALARLLALSDLLGVHDALDWWNLRFVVDSTRQELTVLPRPVSRHAAIPATLVEQTYERVDDPGRAFVDRVLADPSVNDRYLAYLDTFSAEGWWEVVRERTRPIWSTPRQVINADRPDIDLDLHVVLHDRTVIHQMLAPRDIALAYVNDTLVSTDGVVIANVHSLPFEVVGLVLTTGDTTHLRVPVRLEPRARDRPLRYTYLPLNVPGSPRDILVRVCSKCATRPVRIRTWSSLGAN